MRSLGAALMLALVVAAPAAAKPRLTGGGMFSQPVQVAAPPGDERLFVVELAGKVRVLGKDRTLAARPFLDVSAEVARGAEQGLLGLAFAPDYATTGELFVFLTVKDPARQIQIRRYRVSAGDPNRVDAASAATILRVDKGEFETHNGGTVRFGPDGKLWAGFGDGGRSNDNLRSGQSLTTLLGKIVRLERDGAPAAGNPFATATDGTRPEIWQYGLRNPFRFAFDRATGDLVLGDVGEEAREEVDLAPAARDRLPGANWGWPCFEGTKAVNGCEAPGALPPAFELDHDEDGARSISMGVVVRDPGLPTLTGRLLYGDLGFNRLHALTLATRRDTPLNDLLLQGVVSIDEDGCGRPLVTSIGGRVARIADGAISKCTTEGTTPAVPEVEGCGLTVKRGERVRLTVRAPCRIAFRRDGRLRRLRMLPGETRVLRRAHRIRAERLTSR